MRESTVVKVTVTENQTRITIPKPLAIRSELITDDGSPGKYTHVLLRLSRRKSLFMIPVKMDISEENNV